MRHDASCGPLFRPQKVVDVIALSGNGVPASVAVPVIAAHAVTAGVLFWPA